MDILSQNGLDMLQIWMTVFTECRDDLPWPVVARLVSQWTANVLLRCSQGHFAMLDINSAEL